MLTPAQIQTLGAAIQAETDAAFVAMRNAADTGAMAGWFNGASAFIVWRSSVSTDQIFDQIAWANFTPSGTPGSDAAWTNRSLACQGKQFNLQTMLVGRTSLDPSKPRIRAGLQDALTDIPSGNNGNLRQGGWAQVEATIKRAATRGERLFATGTGSDATPGALVVEGAITDVHIAAALGL